MQRHIFHRLNECPQRAKIANVFGNIELHTISKKRFAEFAVLEI